jgi:hypothetical protein
VLFESSYCIDRGSLLSIVHHAFPQVVEELFAYWVLEDADQELEELEDALIVS